MNRTTTTAALIACLTMGAGLSASAQEPQEPSTQDASNPARAALQRAVEQQEKAKAAEAAATVARLNDKTSLQVQVVVSRYKGDAKIASLLSVRG